MTLDGEPAATAPRAGDQFPTSDPRVEDQIGYALPWWSDAIRAELLTQVRAR